ncbi:hypothetical protein IGI04_031826 [Brassica rapa subsp. trilocularis]|uniref:F-box domain-containing protein n=3 Tax=Brassica campestris TaxID=3711 RepID=M4D2M0_BRACM|nr:hypothetical protein IGI04_031826 [Brassica rapa subsp. trilocularis]
METPRKKLTNGRVNSYSLSLDLMIEIFKRLPLKTLIRSLCVSKQWASIIRGRYFMKLFLNESLTRPKSVVFVFRKRYDGLSYSEVSLKIAHELVPSSSDAASSLATYHVTVHTLQRTKISPSVHGLICYGPPSELIVYNPCTRRSATLPKVNAGRRAINHYLGYDPINNDYKVLCIIRGMPKLSNRRGLAEEILVLTLGSSTHQDSWKMMNIQDNIIPHHSPLSEELCINGVLYYQAFTG